MSQSSRQLLRRIKQQATSRTESLNFNSVGPPTYVELTFCMHVAICRYMYINQIPMMSILHYSDWSGGQSLSFYLSQRNKLLHKEDKGFLTLEECKGKIKKSFIESQCMPLAQPCILQETTCKKFQENYDTQIEAIRGQIYNKETYQLSKNDMVVIHNTIVI